MAVGPGLISVTMFSAHVHHHGLLPAEHEVAGGGAQGHGQAQPDVVRHEDQHETVGQHDLNSQHI